MCEQPELMELIDEIERDLRKVRVHKDYHIAKMQMDKFSEFKNKEIELSDKLYYTKLKLKGN